jgi:hypothetical protein
MSDSLVDVAAHAVGDDIIAAGIFQARGATMKIMAGTAAGSTGGDLLGGAGGSLGVGIGALAGVAASGHDGLYRWLVAVSPTRVYVFVPEGATSSPGGQSTEIRKGEIHLLHAFAREHLEVTAKSRVNVRVLILEDLPTGEKIELEGNRIGWSHSKEVIQALVAHDHESAG